MSEISGIKAVRRVRLALARAEAEESLLAAPDGRVSVSIADLRELFDNLDSMRDKLALGTQNWREQWAGSPPEKGSSIYTIRGHRVAYIGGDEETHTAIREVVAAHNAALAEADALIAGAKP